MSPVVRSAIAWYGAAPNRALTPIELVAIAIEPPVGTTASGNSARPRLAGVGGDVWPSIHRAVDSAPIAVVNIGEAIGVAASGVLAIAVLEVGLASLNIALSQNTAVRAYTDKRIGTAILVTRAAMVNRRIKGCLASVII